jgi:hypothetical protein
VYVCLSGFWIFYDAHLLQLWLDNYTRKKINVLMDTGDFDSVSYLLKVVVHRLEAEYELGGVKITKTKKETE